MEPKAEGDFIVALIPAVGFMVKSKDRSQLRAMTDRLKSRLGLKVQAARRRANLTQEELATRIGRTPESVSNIERGVHLPTLETIFDLASALSMPAAEFLEDASDKRRVSRDRIKLEAQLREIGRSLNDRDLAIAIAQASMFLRSGR